MGGLEELVVPCVARGNARLLGQRGAAGRRLVGSEVTGGGSRCRGAAGDSGRRLGVAGGRCGAIDGSALYFLVASPPRPPYPPVGVIITAAHCNDASHKGRGRVLRLDASGVVAADLVAAGLPAVATAPRGGPAAETAAANRRRRHRRHGSHRSGRGGDARVELRRAASDDQRFRVEPSCRVSLVTALSLQGSGATIGPATYSVGINGGGGAAARRRGGGRWSPGQRLLGGPPHVWGKMGGTGGRAGINRRWWTPWSRSRGWCQRQLRCG